MATKNIIKTAADISYEVWKAVVENDEQKMKIVGEEYIAKSLLQEKLKDFEYHMKDINPPDYKELRKHFDRNFKLLLEDE